MTERSREWLRTFLRLDARSEGTLLDRDVKRQEDTVLRALGLLDEQPGVVLADEVGMGKTYEALGVIAARLQENSKARVLILTPGPSLTTKWRKELAAFCDTNHPMYKGFVDKFAEASSLGALVAKDRKPITVASVTLFGAPRASSDKSYLISAWAEARGLRGNQVAAVFDRYPKGSRVDVQTALFLDTVPWTSLKELFERARASGKGGALAIDALFDERGYDAFKDAGAIDAALTELRFKVLTQLVGDFDLLVVDEAHKLKNADSVRATGVRMVFEKRFDKALFLTATPFQLSVDELGQVFQLFSLARTAPDDLVERANDLLDSVGEYQRAYAAFENVWARSDETIAADFKDWFKRDNNLLDDPEDVNLRLVGARARDLLRLKREKIEPAFRTWMIRSLREDKRKYRKATRHLLKAKEGPGVPFLLYERFIAELFRSKSRTHKAAVQINMVSSFAAARVGALLATAKPVEGQQDEALTKLTGEPAKYQEVLRNVVHTLKDDGGGHPKVNHVVEDCIKAALTGEKTLVFCARVQTLHELRDLIGKKWDELIVARWREVYPDATTETVFDQNEDGVRAQGRHSRLQARFKAPRSPLYLALRERYVPTLLHATDFAKHNLAAIVERANRILAGVRVSQADEIDWAVLKRCVESATAHLLQEADETEHVSADALMRLTDKKFVALGYDLIADDLETSATGTLEPTWRIDDEAASLVIEPAHLWSYVTAQLEGVPADLRVRTVERLAAYLTSRYVPFLPELVAYAVEKGLDRERISARELLPLVDRFWTGAGRPWKKLIADFLTYALGLTTENRREVLEEVVKAGRMVRHTIDADNREMLREAFNTPLYPMVLLANEVMQEGLDLHHHCKRVIHHDLAWNPAQLEQRVGRVDRLGSLVQRKRLKVPETTLDIELPLVRNTIDERLERTVRMRERWLEFLLGAAPKFEEYGLADEPVMPLPEGFAEALRVELGPSGER